MTIITFLKIIFFKVRTIKTSSVVEKLLKFLISPLVLSNITHVDVFFKDEDHVLENKNNSILEWSGR